MQDFKLVTPSDSASAPHRVYDVVLIGAGVMSATLGALLKELDPHLSIAIYERLDSVAEESSAALNNAGTGHSGFCELNYTRENPDGTIETKEAIKINEAFEVSKQFWAYQVKKQVIRDPRSFITNVPHISLVWGEKNVAFLKKRFEALQKHSLFQGMEYSEDPVQLTKWIPLVMKERPNAEKVAATRMGIGTDVNFGSLTEQLMAFLEHQPHVVLNKNHEVTDIERMDDGAWAIEVHDIEKDESTWVGAKFIFIGAGGGALKLLQKSDIPEADGFGGFPVGGMWLVSYNQELAKQHEAKVYGLAPLGSPPMSVPHLDTRVIDGRKALLFGPFATFSTKFLKKGSWLDLPKSLDIKNIMPMIDTGLHNLPLVQYLVGQLLLTPEQRLQALREYFPDARSEDWELELAGQRVQVVKKDEVEGGVLQFGTELVTASDGSLAALLGASPGASSAAPIMLEVLARAFPERMHSAEWQTKMKEIIPSYGQRLDNNPELQNQVRAESSSLLHLKYFTVAAGDTRPIEAH